MKQAASAESLLPVREETCCGKDTCSGETIACGNSCAKEIFIRCAPIHGTEIDLDFRQQTERFYGCLPRLLAQAGADMSHVVLERAFFEDFATDMQAFENARDNAYDAAGIDEELRPAITFIEQPPCRPEQNIEVQVYAVLPHSPETASVRTFRAPDERATAKIVQMGSHKHLYISSVTGVSPGDASPGTFREQSDKMFQRSKKLLARHGAKFPEVLRTWCYLDDIDNTYDEFNTSRNAFFKEEGVTRLPASTGIEAGLYPAGTLVAMDIYALLNPEGVEVEVMHTPTLNEADEYGSAFSRGMKIVLPEKTVLHISGTASVDEKGDTVHLDDPYKQIERMLLNVKELLAPHGATFEDVTQIATFLKSADYLKMYQDILAKWGITAVANTFVETGVCRPNLLCELEAIAILPNKGSESPEDNGDSDGSRVGPPAPHKKKTRVQR